MWREHGAGSYAPTPVDLYHLISAELSHVHARSIAQQEQNQNSKTNTSRSGRAIKRFQPTPYKSALDKYRGLDRARSSMLVQVRTKHIALNQYLYRMQIPTIDSPECPYGRGKENIEHVLLQCPNYAALREETLQEDSKRVSNLTELLGNLERIGMTTRFLS